MIGPGSKLAHYEIVSALGKGGMGEVWRARDTKLGREIAIKTLPPEFAEDPDRLARFEREAKLLASLNHPSIAAIYGLEQHEGTRFLVLELVEGDTLADRLERGAIPVEESLKLALQIAEALEAAHEKGVVHRDLKPANIKVTPEGKVKVLDFGLAKVFGGDGSDVSLSNSPTLTMAATQQGVILGTAAYMSPEQARGRDLDKRTDIWAFGCVLYEMLTARQVFAAEDVSLTLAEVMKSEPDWSQLRPETPLSLRTLLKRCLEKDQKKRLRDIGEARIILADPLSEQPIVSQSSQAPRRPWAWIAVGGALLIILLVVLMSDRAGVLDSATLRSSIALPDGVWFHQVLSPDGRYLAVQGVIEDRTYVFVRALDSWNFRQLEDTVFAANPFWSPDSRSIGFFDAYNKLKYVDVSGGPSQEVADVPGLLNKNGAWGRDGSIVIAPSSKLAPGPLMIVPATGGEPTPLTTTEDGEGHLWPSFLPDGRNFMYTSQGGSAPGIYIASLDSPVGQRILPDPSSAIVTAGPGGSTLVLFVRDGDLWVQAVDVDQPAVIGNATRILEDVPLRDDHAAFVSVSNDGILAYFDGSYRETASRYIWLDANGRLLSDDGVLGPAATVSLSPDEQTMVVGRRPVPSSFTDLFRREVFQDAETPLTFGAAVDAVSNVVWSPDGRHIVYTNATFDLVLKDMRSGSAGRVLVDSTEPVYPMDWSRDGRFLLYSQLQNSTDADLWYVELEPSSSEGYSPVGEPVPFVDTMSQESFGQFSPDGSWMAYVSDNSGEDAIYVVPFPSGNPAKRISPPGRASQPRWKPDGSRLYYIGGNPGQQQLMYLDVTQRVFPSQDAEAVFETASAQPLFDIRTNGFHPAWGSFFYAVAGDGERFLVNRFEITEEPVINIVTNWPRAFDLEP